MTWLLPLLAAWALLTVPGYLLLCAVGARLRLRWGWAPVITVLATVLLTGLFRLLGIPWQLPTAVTGYLAIAALTLLGRLWLARRRPGTAGTQQERTRTWPLPVTAAVTAVCAAGGLAVAAAGSARMGGITTLNGSFDSFFHLSAIAFIRADGDAFLTTALVEIYGTATYYPIVFDALASLLPLGTVAAANAMMLSLLVALPSSVAALVAAVAAERRALPLLTGLAALASTLFLSTAAMALVMGLWPIVLGVVCLPVAIASAVLLLDRRAGTLTRAGAIGHAAVLLGTALAHPSMLFSVAVVGGLLVLVRGIARVRAGQGRRGWAEVTGALLAAVIFVLVSGTLLSGMHLTRHSSEGIRSVLWEILADSPRIPEIPAPIWPLAAVWVLAVLGAVVAARRGEILGITAAVGVLASIVLGIATQIEHPLTVALVNPWYGARERIAPLMMCLLVLLMARGVRALIDRGRRHGRPVVGAVAAGVVVVTAVAGLVLPQRLPLLGSLAYTAYGVHLSPYVTEAERDFIEDTADALDEDAVVIADPLDGATLYWSVGGVETVYPTMSRPLTRDTTLLANYITDPDDGREVCAAYDRIGPTHLYRDHSPHSGRQMNPEASARWEGVHDIPADRLTLVAQDGPYALYELEPTC